LDEVEWNWLREGMDGTTDTPGEESSAPPTPDEIMFSMDDELARETIKAEDKLGILSFGMWRAALGCHVE
jgi:hypothetical protein